MDPAAGIRRARWQAPHFNLAYRADGAAKKEELLDTLIKIAAARRYTVQIDDGWRPFDLKIAFSAWGHVLVLAASVRDQNERDLLLIRCAFFLSWWIWFFISVGAALITVCVMTKPSQVSIPAALGLIGLVAAVRQMLAFGRAVQTMILLAAQQSALTNHPGV